MHLLIDTEVVIFPAQQEYVRLFISAFSSCRPGCIDSRLEVFRKLFNPRNMFFDERCIMSVQLDEAVFTELINFMVHRDTKIIIRRSTLLAYFYRRLSWLGDLVKFQSARPSCDLSKCNNNSSTHRVIAVLYKSRVQDWLRLRSSRYPRRAAHVF